MTEEYCISECMRVINLAQKYVDEFDAFFTLAEKTVRDTQYGTGGTLIHRGYFCPSHIIDIVVGNVSRGRLSKKPGRKPVDYIYGFDNSNHLITIKKSHSREFLIYQKESVLGISVSKDGTYTISETTYDEYKRLLVYSVYYGQFSNIVEFRRESYLYEESTFIVNMYHYSNYLLLHPILEHNRYLFIQNADKVISYTFEEYHQGERIASIWDGHIFAIPSKKQSWLWNRIHAIEGQRTVGSDIP